jgi:hypothetical protein
MHKWVEVVAVQVAQASPSWVVFAPDLVESVFHFQFQVRQLHTLQVEMVMTIQDPSSLQEQMEPETVVVQDLLVDQA